MMKLLHREVASLYTRPYPGRMGLSTGSPTLDLVLEIGIAACLVVLVVLLIRNYRNR